MQAGEMTPELEIPPRVRRRAISNVTDSPPRGNTSACAGKSPCRHPRRVAAWKYLRVCGEEGPYGLFCDSKAEIPPRVRRRAGAMPSRE